MTTNFTITTAYVNLNDGLNKKFDYYMTQGEKLLKIDVNMVIFTDYKSYKFIWDIRNKYNLINKTFFITINLNNFDSYKYKDRITNIKLKNGIPPDSRSTSDYFILMSSKLEMVKRTVEYNPFNSTHFGWIDFGIFGTTYTTETGIINMINNCRDKCSVCYIHYRTKNFIKNNRSTPYCGIAGGILTGNMDYINKIYILYVNKLEEIINSFHCHSDEQILSELYTDNPELFDIYHGDYCSIVSNYYKPIYSISSILKYYMILCRDDNKHQMTYNACERIENSLNQNLIYYEYISSNIENKISAYETLQYYNEYFIAAWYTNNKNKCIDIVKKLSILLNEWPAICNEYKNNYQFYTNNFDFVNLLLPSYKSVCIKNNISDSELNNYINEYKVFIYKDNYEINGKIFLTNNPVIRDKQHIYNIKYDKILE